MLRLVIAIEVFFAVVVTVYLLLVSVAMWLEGSTPDE